jgi:hypothetical protein
MVRARAFMDELKAINLGLVEIVVERITVVKFRMDYGSSDGGGSFEVDEGLRGGCGVAHGWGRKSLKRGMRFGG